MDLMSRSSLKPRSYEEFQPRFEWVGEEGSYTLRCDLSGFKKEQLRVRIDNYGNVTVSGERPPDGDGNRWSRFSKQFRVPENCNTKQIRAKFDNGILYVTMPKLAAAGRAEPKDQPSKAQQTPAEEKTEAEPKPTTRPEEQSRKPTPDAKKAELADAVKDKKEEDKGKSKAPADDDQRDNIKSEVKEREEKVSKVSDDGKKASAEARKEEEAGRREQGKSKYGLGVKKPRVLVVNLAVAVIVIVGLGIYLTYKFMNSPEVDND